MHVYLLTKRSRADLKAGEQNRDKEGAPDTAAGAGGLD